MVTEIHIFNRKIEEVQQRIVELFTEDERMWGSVPVYVHENECVSRNPILLSNIYKLDADEARVPLIESFGERNVRFTADLPAHTPEPDVRAFVEWEHIWSGSRTLWKQSRNICAVNKKSPLCRKSAAQGHFERYSFLRPHYSTEPADRASGALGAGLLLGIALHSLFNGLFDIAVY